ncbi:hypothetical protein [Leptolyngbya sp. FACHB-17]|uniref:hypothetical protein n=1 Tax=unclassified Leptolyngbya TaxID=2650499 RepID=UPI00168148F1|nr:hypothetical protein [Leptolyngbya sp. FACHB-17]MBD2079703.1 hypothetical protein [Leptolyngbya sp. FACHB-17]
MAFHNLIEREISAGEPWEMKQSESYELKVRNVWEIERPREAIQNTSEVMLHNLHRRYRFLSKFRYLRHFVR